MLSSCSSDLVHSKVYLRSPSPPLFQKSAYVRGSVYAHQGVCMYMHTYLHVYLRVYVVECCDTRKHCQYVLKPHACVRLTPIMKEQHSSNPSPLSNLFFEHKQTYTHRHRQTHRRTDRQTDGQGPASLSTVYKNCRFLSSLKDGSIYPKKPVTLKAVMRLSEAAFGFEGLAGG